MNNSKYRTILYFIASVFILILCIQSYWNYKSYANEKKKLLADIKYCMDKAVENYFTEKAQKESYSFIDDTLSKLKIKHRANLNSPYNELVKDSQNITLINTDSIFSLQFKKFKPSSDSLKIVSFDTRYPIQKEVLDSLFEKSTSSYDLLTSKIIVSFTEGSLSLPKIDTLLQKELQNLNLELDYGLQYTFAQKDTISLRQDLIDNAKLRARAHSPFLYSDSNIVIYFKDISWALFKRNLVGIILSLILITGVLASLLYLLHIIKKQKQIAEVKNDLISNITHEFKTPIATIGAAMEGINSFNTNNDIQKSKRYANIAFEQVEKLNTMVEKLLETASLDSDKLSLKLQELDLVVLLEKLCNQENVLQAKKEVLFSPKLSTCIIQADTFHFENALNNILDNALKYGGNSIKISIDKNDTHVTINIEDSGNTLNSTHKKLVFNKFYRVPKGNTHDVKGFGIGLYYTKKIIEKHSGTITLETTPNTLFIISLPI